MNGSSEASATQLDMLDAQRPVVHYFDENGALHSRRMVRTIEDGEHAGAVVVSDFDGNQFIPDRIRNIE